MSNAPDDRTKHSPPRDPRSSISGPRTGLWIPGQSDDGAAPGERIGRYEIRAVLGSGAFGRVYRGYDPDLQRDVAIKVPLGAALTGELRERFLREARAAATIHHPNVCPIYDVGTDGEVLYLVMRLVPGGTLARVLAARQTPLALLHAAAIGRKIALGVAAAHAKDILHRDLKPANVLWDETAREPLITDFGLARIAGEVRMTASGAVMGTPLYMAPEQMVGDTDAVGPLSDIYALGVILYELAVGRPPFRGSYQELVGQKLYAGFPRPTDLRPDLDPRYEAICLKAMAAKPQDRFMSAKELVAALTECIRPRPSEGPAPATDAPPPAPPPPDAPLPSELFVLADRPNRKPSKSRRGRREQRKSPYAWLALGGMIAASVVIGILVLNASLRKKDPAPTERETVERKQPPPVSPKSGGGPAPKEEPAPKVEKKTTVTFNEFFNGELTTRYQEPGKFPGTWTIKTFEESTGRFTGEFVHPDTIVGALKGVLEGVVSKDGNVKASMSGYKGKDLDFRLDVTFKLAVKGGEVETAEEVLGTLKYGYIRAINGKFQGDVPPTNQTPHAFYLHKVAAKKDDPKKLELPSPAPGETRLVELAPGVSTSVVWIPPGECKLGAPKAERDAVFLLIKDQKPTPEWWYEEAEEKRGSYPSTGFWMGKYEVTQEEWAAVMSGTPLAAPSYFRVGGLGAARLGGITSTARFPVDAVNWDMSRQFLDRANAHGGIARAFGKRGRFELPHEDQWEFACRGGKGNRTAFHFGSVLNGEQANCDGRFPFGTPLPGRNLGRTCAVDDTNVGAYPAHPWGLHHMHGNVLEWCSNRDDETKYPVTRGGAWDSHPRNSRTVRRFGMAPDKGIGLRLIVTLD